MSRTVPATERKELVKAIGNKFVAKSEIALSVPVIDAVEKVLGKKMQGCNRLSIDAKGKATLFAARNPDGTEYSEFHFGAGEASVIRIVTAIEDAPDGAMILIEEIENGLHPIATRRMVEYLIDVARRKSSQVIFTTHSNDALDPLPPKAIWAAYNGEVFQGKLDIKALRTVTGQIDAKLAIFVEDRFAELMVTTALRYHGGIEIDAVKITAWAAPARRSRWASSTTWTRPPASHPCASLTQTRLAKPIRPNGSSPCRVTPTQRHTCSTSCMTGSITSQRGWRVSMQMPATPRSGSSKLSVIELSRTVTATQRPADKGGSRLHCRDDRRGRFPRGLGARVSR